MVRSATTLRTQAILRQRRVPPMGVFIATHLTQNESLPGRSRGAKSVLDASQQRVWNGGATSFLAECVMGLADTSLILLDGMHSTLETWAARFQGERDLLYWLLRAKMNEIAGDVRREEDR